MKSSMEFWLATQQYPQNDHDDWLGGKFPYTMTHVNGPHLVFYEFSGKLLLLIFNKGNKAFNFYMGIARIAPNLKIMNHLETHTMVSMETKVLSKTHFWTSFQKNFT